MTLYRITIRKKTNEYQMIIPSRVIERLKESEVDTLIKGRNNQNKVSFNNAEGDRTDVFTESLIEGMNKYHKALKNLVDR